MCAALHERASAWHPGSGTVEEAIGHALAGGDRAASVRLIAAYWYRYIDTGRMATVLGWLRSLGDGFVSADPLAVHGAAGPDAATAPARRG